MYVRLNLATKPLVSRRRFLLGTAIIGFVGLLFLAIFGLRFYGLRKADAELRARTQKLQEERASLATRRQELDRFFAQQENATLQERAKFMKSVMEARSFNWTKMFMDLEQTLPSGVHVVRIDPKLDKGSVAVKFTIGAASEEAKLKVLRAFENSKSFSHIELLSEHATTQPQPGADPLTIEFTAIYATA
jgi:Tfp pilus assembly protein PilN